MNLLKEEHEEKVKVQNKTDPFRDDVDAESLMQNLINLSIKTKIDPNWMERIEEDP